MKRDIAIVVLNYIQYINVIPAIKKLIKKGYTVDFYCPKIKSDDGFQEMFEDARKFLLVEGYNVYDKTQPIEYKVLLEPYPEYSFDFKAKYFIKYRYGNISAKPSIVYKPENYIKYDCILCAGDYDANYLNVFARTVKTGNMKYINFKKRKDRKTSKKNLLYLPTYGDGCSIDEIIEEINNLRKEYYVIAKVHHGTSFLKNETERIEKIKNSVDEFYDYHKELSELLEITDVVLTDNSGSIFEAIYTEIPVAIYCDDVNKFKLDGFNTTQYEMVINEIIPYTNNKKEIKKILKEAQSNKYYQKQKEWNKQNFYHPKNLTNDFVNIIESYLKDEINHRYHEMHNILKKEYYGNKKLIEKIYIEKNEEINKLETEKNNIKLELEKSKEELEIIKENLNDEKKEREILNKKIYYYETGLLYKIAKKIYEIKNGGKNE